MDVSYTAGLIFVAWLSPQRPNPSAMPDSTNHIQAAYNQWAAAYETDKNPTRDLSAKILRQQAFALAGKAILEIGCGTGLNTVWLAKKAALVQAVDISEGMLQQARTRIHSGNVEFHTSDITKPWSAVSDSFDLVIDNLVLEHIQDLAHIFKEARRVLKANGLFYLSELHPYKQLHGSQARYKDAKTNREMRIPAFQHSTAEFVNTAINAGFVVSSLGEWKASGDNRPRLLTLLFARR